NSYFVLGDNSASSKDSRYWGFVPRNYLIGKAVLVIMPFNRMQQINDR
ncbi:MAG TPA: signal peptidase I, partial [Candidatus Omnitrophota bacterium]|nr:signal peptidase I [Candidatus Omnitrophota bacterium]